MAELNEEAPDSSPQWLHEYQRPVEDPVLLSDSPSCEEEDGEEMNFATSSRKKRYMLSESDEEDEPVSSPPEEVEEEENVQEDGGAPELETLDSQMPDEILETERETDAAAALPDEEAGKPEGETKKTKTKMASALPLMFPEKISRSKVLLECEGDSLDLSGDIGAVGRVSLSANNDVLLDLKGTVYKTQIVPSNSFFLVNIGASEAKVEALMNDFVQLIPDSNCANIETMIEGTLEGITFDSEDERVAAPVAAAPSPEVAEDDKKNVRKAKTTKDSKTPKKPSLASSSKVTARKAVKRSGGKVTSKRASKKLK